MRHRLTPIAATGLTLLLAVLLAACGQATVTETVPSIAVAIDPAAATLVVGGTRTFTATVTGTGNTSVNWTVREGATGGGISSGGVYTAPSLPGTYHVVATSVADATRSGEATVTVTAPAGVSLVVSPPAATLVVGGTRTFTATVTGTGNTSVNWTVREGATGGSVSSGGVYTAPSLPGTYHVVATSVADATSSGEATVTVRAPPTGGWLTVVGNQIRTPDGLPWRGRGANLHDTRGCNACTWNAPNPAEVKRRVDELVEGWNANFIRLDLESYGSAGGRVHWQGVLDDPGYLADIQDIVAHATAKPGVYVLLSLWIDPSFTASGWPTPATNLVWARLAEVFKDEPGVLFGLVNEPQSNSNGAQDAQVWAAMDEAVQAIRDVETAAGTPPHVVAVQGTRSWARVLDYYLTHPITAGGGVNIAYETHVYDPSSTFAARFETPSETVPVIIGEFGPASGYMTEADTAELMARAEAHGVSYLAWTFHGRCPPNLLVDNSGGGCGVGMPLTPTSWGQQLKTRLATPW